jgi:hypothetical protein
LCRNLLGRPPFAGEQSGAGASPHAPLYQCPDCRRPMRRTRVNVEPVVPPRPSSFRCDTS